MVAASARTFGVFWPDLIAKSKARASEITAA
jgi:hypothetical protein